ncbi:MAG: DNA double-strand break repair nuclease NurA [Chloroflexi bacterium]|nr:DNA double-strand break repair nuclease NurA [Chloroflexota bacterium]
MALDLTRTAIQIDDMAASLRSGRADWHARLENARAAALTFDPVMYSAKLGQAETNLDWVVPDVYDRLDVSYAPPLLPRDYIVVGVDGSHIDVSRHLPAHCYLINIGGMTLRYGREPGAQVFSTPRLYANADDLVIRDRDAPYREETISGALLDAKRAVEELAGLLKRLRESPPDIPAVGLIDGSLILFGMHRHPPFVVRNLVEEGYVVLLDELRQLSLERPLAIASYISLPRSMEVVNALRLAVCPYPVADCDRECGVKRIGERPCDLEVGDVLDRLLFDDLLGLGERTAAFGSNAAIVRDRYGGHGVSFFYVKTEEEIGRVEVPDWVAEDEALLGVVHSLVVEQCRLGPGYPVALKEAHEQAVVTGADRQYFVALIEDALEQQGLPVYSSEKNISKIRRWI